MELVKTILSNNYDSLEVYGSVRTTIMASNGIFERRSSQFGTSLKKKAEYTTPGQAELSEYLILDNPKNLPKLTREAILYVVKWYRNTTKATGKEAQVNFYYTKNKDTIVEYKKKETRLSEVPGVHFWSEELFSYTPEQTNSGAQTDTTDPFYKLLNEKFGIYIETHSHNSMEAFCSGTDLANSKNDCVQLVFGLLNTNNIQMHSWATVREVTAEKLSVESLEQFVELDDFAYNEKDGKYYLEASIVDNFQYNEDVLKSWDTKVVVSKYRPFTGFTGLSRNFNDYGYTGNGKYKKHKTAKRTQSGYDDYDYYDSFYSRYYNNNRTSSYTTTAEKIENVKSELVPELIALFSDLPAELISLSVDLFFNGVTVNSYMYKTEAELKQVAELYLIDYLYDVQNSVA